MKRITLIVLQVLLASLFFLNGKVSAIIFDGIEIPDTEPYVYSEILTTKKIITARNEFSDGFRYYNAKNFREAIRFFEKSIETFPYENQAYYWLAQTYYMLGDYDKSIETLKQIKETDFIKERLSYLSSGKDLNLNEVGGSRYDVKINSVINSLNFDDKKFISPVNLFVKDDIIFAVSAGDKSVCIFDVNYKLKKKLSGFLFPYGIDYQNGKLFVSDMKDNSIYVYNASNYQTLKKIELSKNPLKTYGITNLCVDSAENIYYIDSGNKSIVKIDKNGTELYRIDNFTKNYFTSISDIRFNSGILYVLDGSGKIFKFDESGNLLVQFEIEKRLIKKPASLTILNGDILITDAFETGDTNIIAILDKNSGKYQGCLMNIGKRRTIGAIETISGDSGNIHNSIYFIYDAANNELLKYDNNLIVSAIKLVGNKITDMVYHNGKLFVLLSNANKMLIFDSNLVKQKELGFQSFTNDKLESFEIINNLIYLKFQEKSTPISIFSTTGEPMPIRFAEKNMTGAVLFNNDIIKYFSFSDTFAISIWPDSVFKNVKYVSADSFYVYIYNDVDNIINAYNRQGTLVNVMRTGLDSKTKLKKFFIKNGYIYLIPKKPSGDFSAINLQTGEIETPFIMRDLALTTNACYRIAADKDKYYYADFEKNSIISLAINEKTTDKYVIDVLSVNSKSMFPHIIENLKIRDVYGNSIMNINESHFEAFEGFSRFSDPEISGFHNFAANSNRDSTIEFRTNYLAKPISIKPTDKYNSENNLIVVIDNCPELLKELKYVKSFLSDLAGKLNFFKYKLDLWGTMGERIEKFLSNSTDKFEFNRISERLLSADNKNSLNLTDAIEEVSERVYDYAGIKTIIFITSNNSDKRFELNEKTKKLIRFMRNNDINIEIINFNRDDYAEGIDLSRFFNDRYHQFPDIAFTKCLENIEYYKPSNYTLFYKTKLAKAPAYTWINQFLFLKYLNNISESRCGFFIP